MKQIKQTTNKNIYLLLFTTAITLFNGFAQGNVGIGTNTPNASSILDINSNNKGFYFRMSHLQVLMLLHH
ncbi:MAG: hypothetical protein H6552_02040 [Chitinophagales bacterium]|nr:hypothetical protein [Chitinophagales bacterium]